MNKRRETKRETGRLREKAEVLLHRREGQRPSDAGGYPSQSLLADSQRLLHELQVHEIELQLQNEELRDARLKTETVLALYTEVFDFAPIGYATLCPDDTIRELNHVGARILGRERGRAVGMGFGFFLAPEDRTRFKALLTRALGDPMKETCEVQALKDDGASATIRVTATALERPDRVVLLAFEDITDQKAKEEKLASTERALREADRRKDEFLAMLSHELRNPLAPIRNSVYVLARAEPGGEQARRALGTIDRQVTHLTRLIDDLLDMTRISEGKIRLRCERIEIGEAVRRSIDDLRPTFERGGIALEDRLEPDLLWVNADPARLVQIVSNILGNAVKFTPRGERVVVTLARAAPNAVLRIADTGVGISPGELERVFEPFAQAPQTLDRTRGGLGLGLAMVKALVELHHGTVCIASEGLGRGAEVTVTIPLQAAPRQRTEDAPKLAVRKHRVLVVEDNAEAAESLKEALEFDGHDVRVAYDGVAGLTLARSFWPEIVICDIGLPGMDGYDVARAFRADESLRGNYLVALSGYAQPEDLDRARRAGFDQHVAKPPSIEALERLIAQLPVRTGTDPIG